MLHRYLTPLHNIIFESFSNTLIFLCFPRTRTKRSAGITVCHHYTLFNVLAAVPVHEQEKIMLNTNKFQDA